MPLLLLELNEINFDHVRAYAKQGKLPVLGGLIDAHGVTETTSEQAHEELEPWIQWVTAHTGLTLAEHGVFRLGDIVHRDIPQIWEVLEAQGLTVGAVAPMNAKNRCRSPAFFVPDPWTPTDVAGSTLLRRLSGAIAQAVNDNASARLEPGSIGWILAGALRYARPANYARYMALAASARRRPWAKALVLDQLLADIFVGLVLARRPDFASLFLNAGAHIQHHYMFNSAAYGGAQSNPDWYVAPDRDPVLDVYALYDRIVGQVMRAAPNARLMLATGLHQDPHPAVTYYWRLRNHADFLAGLGIGFVRVEPRMSRDFLVVCASAEEAATAERILNGVTSMEGERLFEVDNRGSDLFVMLTWPHDIPAEFEYRAGNLPRRGLREEVAFVAIKNGEHNGIGYFVDTGGRAGERMPLARLPRLIAEACGARWGEPARDAA